MQAGTPQSHTQTMPMQATDLGDWLFQFSSVERCSILCVRTWHDDLDVAVMIITHYHHHTTCCNQHNGTTNSYVFLRVWE